MSSPIYAMWLRQVKKHLRSKPRMIGSLGQPILFLVALGYGFGTIFEQAGEGNFITFLAPGIIAMSILFSAMFTGIEVIWDRQFGFLKETLVAPVSRFRIMLGRTLGGATAALMQGLIVFAISMALGFRPSLIMLPVAFLFMASIAILFTSLGTAIASKMQDMQAFPIIMNLIMMPLFFLSGALFPLDQAPAALKFVVYLNPLAYGVDGVRAAMTGASHFGLITDIAVQFGLMLLVLFIGSRMFEKIEV